LVSQYAEEPPVKACDNSSGKRQWAMPEIAASQLVSLSAWLLKCQNPGEICGDLLNLAADKWAARWDSLMRKSFLLMQSLRSFVTIP
jgi:hypothetical protein